MKKIYVKKSSIHGKGIFAGEDIQKGERIQYITGKKVHHVFKKEEESSPTNNWVGIGHNVWIDPDKVTFQFLNHSCDPNAAIVGTKTLVALRDIPKDEEIKMDYSMTEFKDHFWKMKCKCGSSNCRGLIEPINKIPKEVFASHFPHIPRYFQRAYLRNYILSQKQDN